MQTDSRASKEGSALDLGGGAIVEMEQVCTKDSEKDRRALAQEASMEVERKNNARWVQFWTSEFSLALMLTHSFHSTPLLLGDG